jgi:hypothetical protein
MVLVAVGCASDRLVRQATRTTAGHVDQLNQSLSEYAKSLEADSAGRIERLVAQRRSLAAAEYELQARLAVWAIARREGEIKLYDSVAKATNDAVVADRALRVREAQDLAALKETQARLDTQAKQLKSLVQQLGELAEPPTLQEQTAFLFEYFKSVGEEVKKLREESKKAEQEAEKKAN